MLAVKKMSRRGGHARANSLFPETRQCIARKAADAKWAKRRGLPAHGQFIERLVGELRAADPDLAAFVEIVTRIPIEDQGIIFKMLDLEKLESLRQTEEISSCPA